MTGAALTVSIMTGVSGAVTLVSAGLVVFVFEGVLLLFVVCSADFSGLVVIGDGGAALTLFNTF